MPTAFTTYAKASSADRSDRNMPAIQVNSLSIRYGERVACEQVEFAVYPGERIAVIGPNGAGKSTLFKAIVGLIPMQQHGTLVVDGKARARSQHSLISYVPQHEGVDWQFPANVWDVVMMARARHIGYSRWPRRHDRDRVREALKQVEMWDYRQRQIGELSGGQRRRVFIARALAQEARILLMDEPFAGVDATTEADVFRVLDVLRDHDVAVIVATHNLGQAATHYDRVLMLNQHQIAFGPPQQVYTIEHLSQTFGGYLTMLDRDNEKLIVSDKPCHHEDCD